MTTLRPELIDVKQVSMGYESAYFRVLQAVSKKRFLIHGRLHNNGHSCAIGYAFRDGVESLPSKVVEEIAAYNDSFPKLSEKERWKKVHAWLKWKVKVMAAEATK